MTNIRNDEEVLQECERLGEAGVVAALESNDFADNIRPAIQWLAQHRLESERLRRNEDREAEHKRHQEAMKYTRFTSFISGLMLLIALVTATVQQVDAKKQRDDAKALLSVQMSVEFDKQFDSPEMHKARKMLALELLNHKNGSLSGIVDFFDKLSMYKQRKVIDEDLVYQSYSYWIVRYWPALKTSIDSFRSLEKDQGYYQDFEQLYNESLVDDAKNGIKKPDENEIHRFLEEEATLSQ